MNRFAAREIRGWILRILYMNMPEWAGDHLISQILTDAQYRVSPAQVQGHLNYLAEKGYVELKEVTSEETGLTRHIARLTPKGIDLVEGNIPEDPGVDRR